MKWFHLNCHAVVYISSTNLKVVTTPLLTVVICHKHFINSSLCIWTEVLEITVVVVLLIIVVL